MPCAIIGSIVEDKPNFMECTWFSRVNRNPPIWMVSINIKHHTLKGIMKNQVFTINLPQVGLVQKTDYLGTVSGKEVDKSSLFDVYYGETKAPMIKECSINIELKVNSITEFSDHFVIHGNAINSYVDKQYMTDGKPNLKKMDPIIYAGAQKQYWSVGDKLADAFKIGKELIINLSNE